MHLNFFSSEVVRFHVIFKIAQLTLRQRYIIPVVSYQHARFRRIAPHLHVPSTVSIMVPKDSRDLDTHGLFLSVQYLSCHLTFYTTTDASTECVRTSAILPPLCGSADDVSCWRSILGSVGSADATNRRLQPLHGGERRRRRDDKDGGCQKNGREGENYRLRWLKNVAAGVFLLITPTTYTSAISSDILQFASRRLLKLKKL